MSAKRRKRRGSRGKRKQKGGTLKTIFTVITVLLIAAACIIAVRAVCQDLKAQESGQSSVKISETKQPKGSGQSELLQENNGGEATQTTEDGSEATQTTDGDGETPQTAESGETTKTTESGGEATSATESSPPVKLSEDKQPQSTPDDNQPLMLGNPSGASDTDEDNYLMIKTGYVLSYNAKSLTANWAAWHLEKADLGDAVRSNTFRVDDTLGDDFLRIKSSDYQFNTYGFDRGHLCPSADRTANDKINSETFLMTNMVPQSPDNNRVAWKSLETYERDAAASGKELYIFAGVLGVGGESEKGEFNEITLNNGKSITVPAYTWKVMIIIPAGDGDLNRIDLNAQVVAVMVPNRQGLGKWQKYTTTVDVVEDSTTWDFFAVLPDDIEDALEARLTY